MDKIEAILFDMDGVIVDSMDCHAESWQMVFRDYGISLSKQEIFKREGMSGVSSIIDIITEKGFPVPDEHEIKGLLEKKLKLFEKSKIHLYPCVEEMLMFITSKNVQMGLVTGSLARSVKFVLPEKIFQLFNTIVTVDDISNGKPHPEPYIKAMDRLECNTGNALVIENAPLGITSAKEAGLECYAIQTTLPESYLKKADKIFQDHESLFEYIKAII